jgi:hypothetical protein
MMTRSEFIQRLGGLTLSTLWPIVHIRGGGAAAAAQLPGAPASADVREAIESTIRTAIRRLEARDVGGVLVHVSEQYRTEDLTKVGIRDQLSAVVALYDALRVRLRVDDVRVAGDTAWIWTTGELMGRLPVLPVWTSAFTWERMPEVARRENGAWRLYGFQ